MKKPKTKATKSLMDTMQELGQKVEVLPEDPVARVRFLIGQKESTLAEKAMLEAHVAELEDKLKLIAKAEAIFAQLEALLK